MSNKDPDHDYRYSIIPGRAPTDKRLMGRDLQVLCLLGRHTKKNGWCIRSQVVMAQEIGIGRATIQRSLDRLLDAGYLERKATGRGRAKPDDKKQPFSSYWYRVKIDAEDKAATETRVPNNGHPPVEDSDSSDGVPTLDGQGVLTQDGQGVPTHRRAPLKGSSKRSNLNALSSADADERAPVALLKEPESIRFPEFRRVVFDTWPGGFPEANEVAARKAWDRVTRQHPADLIIACARLHGTHKASAKKARGANDGREMIKLPSNWLQAGDWQGYIPRAEAAVADEAKIVTALGNVRRALGDGLFDLLRQSGMSDASVAMLDGMTHQPTGHFTVTRPFQRTLVERYSPKIERHLGRRISFQLVPKAVAS